MGKGPGRSTANTIIDKVVLGKHIRVLFAQRTIWNSSLFSSSGLVLKETATLIGKNEKKNSKHYTCVEVMRC